MATIISIISGKGGSGKSLLTSIIGRALAREGERVLLVDTDIFVRGLTVLLSSSFKRTNVKGITVSDILGIFANDSKHRDPISQNGDYQFERFFECDILPAISKISDPLDYDDRRLSDEEFNYSQLGRLIEDLHTRYDYILLDNRAGLDSLVIASCRLSNFILSVAEDDDVGRQTNLNLVNYLKFNRKITDVYTIINKGRKITSFDDIKKRRNERSDFSILGVIPFDIEILDEFGNDRFWFTVNETLYFRSVIEAWNNLSSFEEVREISTSKYRFPPSIFMQRSQGKYSFIERVLRLYGVMAVLGGIGFYIYYSLGEEFLTSPGGISIIISMLGALLLLASTSNFVKWLLPKGKRSARDERNNS